MFPAEVILACFLRPQQAHHAVEHASRSEVRPPIVVSQPVHPAASTSVYEQAHEWANEPFSIKVANCESGGSGPTYTGNPHIISSSGYEGKWQFSPTTYVSVGGVGNAAYASEAEQDYRAWLLWRESGWGPWQCATG